MEKESIFGEYWEAFEGCLEGEGEEEV